MVVLTNVSQGIGPNIGILDRRLRNRTGATAVPGQLVLLDMENTVATNDTLGDPDSGWANFVQPHDTAADAGPPAFGAVANRSVGIHAIVMETIANGEWGLCRISGPCLALVNDASTPIVSGGALSPPDGANALVLSPGGQIKTLAKCLELTGGTGVETHPILFDGLYGFR